jgi:hypothetical protein
LPSCSKGKRAPHRRASHPAGACTHHRALSRQDGRGAFLFDARRNLSWLALSFPIDLSPNGQTLLFREEGGAVGVNYAVCVRKTDGSGVIQLGEGSQQGLSPDGKWALVTVPTSPDRLMLYPTGPGEPRRLGNCIPGPRQWTRAGRTVAAGDRSPDVGACADAA